MHYKQNKKESKTYVQGLRPFGNTLPRGVKGILKKNGYNYSEIINKWNMLVGKAISNCSYPKSIKMKKGDSSGILVLAIKRGDEINIEYSKKNIIDKINSYFGYKYLNKIRLESTNSGFKKNKSNIGKFADKFEKKIKQIKDERIKNSLKKLVNAMKNE